MPESKKTGREYEVRYFEMNGKLEQYIWRGEYYKGKKIWHKVSL